LVGIGKFTQGSGFSKEEAELIAKLLNARENSIALKEMQERQL
jgi:hypothetical protein